METIALQSDNKKIINAWCLYDWANSVYSLTITSAIFPIYYQAVAISANGDDIVSFFGVNVINSVLYSYALSFSFLLVALVLPVLSGIADYTGKKRMFLKIFMFIGSFSCMGLFFFTGKNIEWGIICSVFASVGYSGSLIFYDAFLPEIASEDRRDIVSAKGYSYGYIGGVILLIVNLVIIEQFGAFGLPDEAMATRLAFMMVGIWWIGFSLYAIARLPNNVHDRKPEGYFLANGYKQLSKVWEELKGLGNMRRYLIAFFFYNGGTQTVMYLAVLFASKELGLGKVELISTILIIQFVAVLGAYLFAFVSKKRGNIESLLYMVFIWLGCCIYAFFVTAAIQFYVLAGIIGLVMGGIQALSRATFSKIMPKGTMDTTSFFSFYDVTYNLSIVFGTFIYGFIEQISGSMRNSTLALAAFFILGIIFLSQVKINHAKTEPA